MPAYISPYQKPKLHSACNSCGYCCSVQQCEIAKEFLGAGDAGVCPALEINDQSGGLVCGMIVRPLHYLLSDDLKRIGGNADDPDLRHMHKDLSSSISKSLGAGRGCDSDDDENSVHWPWLVNLKNGV